MGKAATVAMVVFGMGAFALRLLGGWAGVLAEPVSLGMVGVGLYAGSQMLSGRWATQPGGAPVKTS
jgi:hypothetical protein